MKIVNTEDNRLLLEEMAFDCGLVISTHYDTNIKPMKPIGYSLHIYRTSEPVLEYPYYTWEDFAKQLAQGVELPGGDALRDRIISEWGD